MEAGSPQHIFYIFIMKLKVNHMQLKVSKSRKQFMVKWILQKNEHWISTLEDYYFKVSTKESLSSCKKNIDSLFELTLK